MTEINPFPSLPLYREPVPYTNVYCPCWYPSFGDLCYYKKCPDLECASSVGLTLPSRKVAGLFPPPSSSKFASSHRTPSSTVNLLSSIHMYCTFSSNTNSGRPPVQYTNSPLNLGGKTVVLPTLLQECAYDNKQLADKINVV